MRLPQSRNYSLIEAGKAVYCANGCQVKKGELRVAEYVGTYMGHGNYNHYCLKCGLKVLSDEINDMLILKNHIENFTGLNRRP